MFICPNCHLSPLSGDRTEPDTSELKTGETEVNSLGSFEVVGMLDAQIDSFPP